MLISNCLIEDLIEKEEIDFSLFDKKALGLIEYHLKPVLVKLRELDEDGRLKDGDIHDLTQGLFAIAPQQYVTVSIKEEIKLTNKKIFVQFYPASSLIENGIMLNHGWLRPGYKGRLWFGLYNASDLEFRLEKNTEIARAVFFKLPDEMPIADDPERVNVDPKYNENLARLREWDGEIQKLQKDLEQMQKRRHDLEKKIKYEM
jgi:deoxycytidine triphosphate deaminase